MTEISVNENAIQSQSKVSGKHSLLRNNKVTSRQKKKGWTEWKQHKSKIKLTKRHWQTLLDNGS